MLKKPVIFISAVSRELKTSRQLVANTLLALGFEPVWQEIFEVSPDEIPALLRKKIDRCSAMLQIVGDAFGGESPEAPPGAPFARCSYTQYEALYAKSVGKPVYYLIASPELPRDLTLEQLDEDEEKRRLQREYKEAVRTGRTIHYSVGSHDSTENKVHRLKAELDKLRRGVLRLMAISGMGLAILICLIVTGIVLQQRSDAKADADRDHNMEQREREIEHQKELAEKQRQADQAIAEREEETRKRIAAEAAAAAERETWRQALALIAQHSQSNKEVAPLMRLFEEHIPAEKRNPTKVQRSSSDLFSDALAESNAVAGEAKGSNEESDAAGDERRPATPKPAGAAP